AAYRFHVAVGGIHPGDATRLCQPRARQSRRVRRGDAGGVAAVRARGNPGHAAGVSRSVFRDPVHDRDLHHGDPRALAQRGGTLARAPPAGRQLFALHADAGADLAAGARRRAAEAPAIAGLSASRLSLSQGRQRQPGKPVKALAVTFSWSWGPTLISAPT